MPAGKGYDNPRGGTSKGSGTASPAAGARKLIDVKNQGTTTPRVGGMKPVKSNSRKAIKIATGKAGKGRTSR